MGVKISWNGPFSSLMGHVEIMSMVTMVLPSDCLIMDAKISTDVEGLKSEWHNKHKDAVRGV
jgi:hypothetical protein